MYRTAMTTSPGSTRRRRFLWLLALLVLAGVVGGYVLRGHILPESSPFIRGREVALAAGCFACHGEAEELRAAMGHASGAATPSRRRVPGLMAGQLAAAQLRRWIVTGSAKHESVASGDSPLEMPAYGSRLSDEEIDDLVLYLTLMQRKHRWLQEHGEGTGFSAAEGLARGLGCFTCHGEFGQGGVGNPGSLKGCIPGWFGQDFDLLTGDGDREQVRQWISDGHSREFIEQSILGFEPARYFTERQVIGMPAYGKQLDAAAIELLTDYVIQLRAIGPLSQDLLDEVFLPERASDSPPWLASLDTSPFARVVAPILERHCIRCHGPSSAKSGYRMDRRDSAIRGGEICQELLDCQAIVPGSSEGSLLIRYVESRETDEHRLIFPMPPLARGTARLTGSEMRALRQWIDAGAHWPEGATLNDEE